MKENAPDHSDAIKDHIIVLISDPVMLASWRKFEIGHRLNIPKEKPATMWSALRAKVVRTQRYTDMGCTGF